MTGHEYVRTGPFGSDTRCARCGLAWSHPPVPGTPEDICEAGEPS
jgi:hypothetical protein